VGRTSWYLWVWLALWFIPDSFSDPGGFSRIDEAFENLIKSSHYSILVLKSLKDGHTDLAGGSVPCGETRHARASATPWLSSRVAHT
jgi:hypothetical protein